MTDSALGTASTAHTLRSCCSALAATPAGLLRPRQADEQLLAAIEHADAPTARRSVRLQPLTQARMSAPGMVVAEGAWRPLRCALGMTSFLVEHSQARFVVDPSLCSGVHQRVMPQLPAPFRAFVSPDKPVRGLAEMIVATGMSTSDIDFVLPTHLHWDHVSGLLELPNSIMVRTNAVERDWAMHPATAPLGVARGPLFNRSFDFYELDGPPVLTFERSHDLFGDGSVVLVDLAGHTPGSVGVLLHTEDSGPVLLAGDAVWHGRQVTMLRRTAEFPGRLVDADRDTAFKTLHRLHALPAGITLVASHDLDAVRALPGWRGWD